MPDFTLLFLYHYSALTVTVRVGLDLVRQFEVMVRARVMFQVQCGSVMVINPLDTSHRGI